MILSFFFHHSNGFIHEPVTFSPGFKNPDANGISAVVNRLQLVIDLTDFLWNIHFDTDHAESLSYPTFKLVVTELTAIQAQERRGIFATKKDFNLNADQKWQFFIVFS